MKLPYITNIQKYSIHDGKGIRTTVFFKGCPLSCQWCHNPETQSFSPEVLVNPELCTGCGTCENVCPQGAVSIKRAEKKESLVPVTKENLVPVTDGKKCSGCETCLDYCVKNARELSGKQYTIQELLKELLKDRAFYEQSGGGITLSGGEVLAQDVDYVEKLAMAIKKCGLSLNIDTCGAVPFSNIERLLPWTDTFLYDLKLLEEEDAVFFTGNNGRLILSNLEKLSAEKKAEIWIRLPIIGGVNDTLAHMEQISRFLQEKQIVYSQINLLPYHSAGSSKYMRMGRTYEGCDFYTPSAEKMEELAEYLRSQGCVNVKIGG